jgi:hypothetical protein
MTTAKWTINIRELHNLGYFATLVEGHSSISWECGMGYFSTVLLGIFFPIFHALFSLET